MCGLHANDYFRAARVARQILRANGIPDEESHIDTLDPDVYSALVEEFAAEVNAISHPLDLAGVAEASAILDVAWTTLTLDQQRRVIADAARALSKRFRQGPCFIRLAKMYKLSWT